MHLWDADSCQQVLALPYRGPARMLEFDPTSTRLALVGEALFVWDLNTGNRIVELELHTEAINSVAFSPDGDRLITASTDGTAWIVRLFSSTQGLIDYARSFVPRELTPCERKRFFLPVEGEAGDCPN